MKFSKKAAAHTRTHTQRVELSRVNGIRRNARTRCGLQLVQLGQVIYRSQPESERDCATTAACARNSIRGCWQDACTSCAMGRCTHAHTHIGDTSTYHRHYPEPWWRRETALPAGIPCRRRRCAVAASGEHSGIGILELGPHTHTPYCLSGATRFALRSSDRQANRPAEVSRADAAVAVVSSVRYREFAHLPAAKQTQHSQSLRTVAAADTLTHTRTHTPAQMYDCYFHTRWKSCAMSVWREIVVAVQRRRRLVPRFLAAYLIISRAHPVCACLNNI